MLRVLSPQTVQLMLIVFLNNFIFVTPDDIFLRNIGTAMVTGKGNPVSKRDRSMFNKILYYFFKLLSALLCLRISKIM